MTSLQVSFGNKTLKKHLTDMIIFARVFDYSEIGLTPYFSLSARPFVIVVADAVTNVSSHNEKVDANVRYYTVG